MKLIVGEAWQRSDPETTQAARLILSGQWLTEAGFPPGTAVDVTNPELGVLIILAGEEEG